MPEKPAYEELVQKVRKLEEKTASLEGQLENARRMEVIAALAAHIAHQFNNAIFGISGSIDLLKLFLPENDRVGKYFGAIKKSAQQMATLVRQLSTYAHGNIYDRSVLSLNRFVEDMLPSVKLPTKPSLEIATDLASDVPEPSVDITQMRMVFSAILENAVSSMEHDGSIRIATCKKVVHEEDTDSPKDVSPGAYACLSVEDGGRGMDADTRDRLFTPFYATDLEKRGLSMSGVHSIVSEHGGWMALKSEPGKGTVLSIFLPAVN